MTHDATEFNSEPGLNLPDCLQPGPGYEDWRAVINGEVLDIASGFTRQFGIEFDVAAVSVLAAAGQALGGAQQFELPHIRFGAPFNVMVLTPETDPLWAGVPLRFLRDGLEDYLAEHYIRENAGSEQCLTAAVDPQARMEQAKQRVRELLAGRTLETVYRESVSGPFAASPLDRYVTLATPRRGLLRAMARLTPIERLKLEDALLGGDSSSSEAAAYAFATPSFYWHLPEHRAGEFFRLTPWMRRLPFLLLRTEDSGFPQLDAGCDAARAFQRIGQQFFAERIHRADATRVLRLDAESGKPVMEFLHAAQRDNARIAKALPLRWIAELGLKFTLVQMGFKKADRPSPALVKSGLEVAKHFARVHLTNLAAFDSSFAAENVATADLTTEERRSYLKICESEGITGAELRRCSRGLSAAERDEIVAKLLSMGLIRKVGDRLLQNVA